MKIDLKFDPLLDRQPVHDVGLTISIVILDKYEPIRIENSSSENISNVITTRRCTDECDDTHF